MHGQQRYQPPDDQRIQALLGAALQPQTGEAPPAELAERVMRATLPRRAGESGVLGRVGRPAGWLAAAAAAVLAVGLGAYWHSERPSVPAVWSTADESRLAVLAQADSPKEKVEVELRTLAIAVQDARATDDDWSGEELAEAWTQSESSIGVF